MDVSIDLYCVRIDNTISLLVMHILILINQSLITLRISIDNSLENNNVFVYDEDVVTGFGKEAKISALLIGSEHRSLL